ncbi:MAG: ABC transporter ATP-binding protein [Chloroflexi bacterium]|nr:ABC transporter ATP-binding protein [Chloroflexota bacterium]
MKRLLPYLKPYWLLIVMAVALLYVQANAELALPDYMSRIVNVGIQQSGIDNAVPDAMRAQQLDRLLLLVDEDDRELIRQNYTLVQPLSAEAIPYITRFPILDSEPVYVRGEIERETTAALDAALAPALAALSGIEQMAALVKEGGLSETPAGTDPAAGMTALGIDPSLLAALSEGADVFVLLEALPQAQKETASEAISAQTAALGESMVMQMARAQIRNEYLAMGVDVTGLQQRYILRIGLVMLLVSLLGGVCTITVGFLSSRTSSGVARDLRRAVFSKVESFSSSEFDRFSTASLITRSTNDITQVQMVVGMSIRMVAYAPIMGVGGVIRALGKSSSMWWLIALAVIALIGVLAVVFSAAMPRFRVIQSKIDRLNLVMREHLSGMMVIRAFNKQGDEARRFDTANTELTSISLYVARVMVTLMPVMTLIMTGLSLAIIWVGAHQIAQSALQVGDMMAFMQYAGQILMSFMMMSMMFINLPRAAVSGDRVADVLETELAIADPPSPRALPEPFSGSVEFRNVSFRYPSAQEDVLHAISFTAAPGETTALIGSTGSGKSTLVNLIPRFYDVTEGAILISGVDVREVRQADLRDRIGYIPQVATLFSGTIASNLLYGDREASPDVLQQATRIAQAEEFIAAREEGIDAEIAQGGANVSGGQRQRLSIARALVKRPPIFIFDDSFSALDYRTDAALRRALKEETGNSTVIIVTQRVATIRHAEQIIVLDEGRVVGRGTHSELMETCPTYQDIAFSQLSREELA